MNIHLRYYYRGKPSNDRLIPAGIYDENDPALFGLANYLVQNGHAVFVSEPTVTTEAVTPDSLETEIASTVIEIIEEPKAGLPMPTKRGRRPRQ